MNGWLTVGLLVVSNIFMTFAWYGQLKLQQMKVITSATPLITVILLSWGIALFEYCFMVPANRYGFHENGGAFSLLQLKSDTGGNLSDDIYSIHHTVFSR